MKYQKLEIPSIKDEQLIELLKSKDLYNNIINKKTKCYCCEEIQTIDTINYIYVINNELKFICNKEECIKNLKIENNG